MRKSRLITLKERTLVYDGYQLATYITVTTDFFHQRYPESAIGQPAKRHSNGADGGTTL